jgi:predicted amidophosphoribosyltransferase
MGLLSSMLGMRCAACGVRHAVREMKRSPRDRRVAVCQDCFGKWDQNGRRCIRCKEEVKGVQALAYFRTFEGFGHYDCGGVPIHR